MSSSVLEPHESQIKAVKKRDYLLVIVSCSASLLVYFCVGQPCLAAVVNERVKPGIFGVISESANAPKHPAR